MKTWQRIRQRPSLLASYRVRETVTDTIRQFFKEHGCHEVQTPLLIPVPSCEPNLEVFSTHLKTQSGTSRTGYLSMSPEFSIKKLLAAGVGDCFEITRAFRNGEEASRLHNSEFTILEWYRTGTDYLAMMEEVEQLWLTIIKSVKPDTKPSAWRYQGIPYNLTPPWPRIAVEEAFSAHAHLDAETLVDDKALLTAAREKGYEITSSTTWEEAFYQIFFNEVEPQLATLKQPYFLYDYPLQQASLARRKQADPRFAERFEVFLAGVELGNCFSELLDWKDQEKRFEQDLIERQKKKLTTYPMDSELIAALKQGLPTVAGIAMGVDRLVMLAADVPTVADTLFFPEKELFDLESGAGVE